MFLCAFLESMPPNLWQSKGLGSSFLYTHVPAALSMYFRIVSFRFSKALDNESNLTDGTFGLHRRMLGNHRLTPLIPFAQRTT